MEIPGHEEDECGPKHENNWGLERICRETVGSSGDEGGRTGERNAAGNMQPSEGRFLHRPLK